MKDNYYDKISKSYNELHGEEQKKKMQIVLKYLPKNPKQRSILDVGCGTGLSTPNEQCGIDPSEELIKQHIGYSDGRTNKQPMRIFLGSAEKMQFKDKQFNYVISLTALHHCDIEKALNEIKRVGKKYILSILKKANDFKKFDAIIKKKFVIKDIIEEDKDIIYVFE